MGSDDEVFRNASISALESAQLHDVGASSSVGRGRRQK